MNQKHKQGTLKRLLSYLSNYKLILIISLVFTVIVTIIQVFTPVILGRILNHLQIAFRDQIPVDLERILKIVLLLIGMYLVLAVADIVKERTLVYLSQRLIRDMRTEVSKKIKKVPLKYFDNQSTGDLISRMTNDIDKVGHNIQVSVSQIFGSLMLVSGILIMMLKISWILSVAFLLTVPLSFLATKFITSRSRHFFQEKSSGLGRMVGFVEENFTGTDLIKAFSYEEQSDEDFRKINDHLYEVSWRASFMAGVLLPVMTFIGNLAYVTIAIIGGVLVISRSILIGDVLAFLQYSQNIRRPIEIIAEMANQLQETLASAERVFKFLDAPEETENDTNQIHAPIQSIIFDQVNFAYEKDKPVIKNLNLSVGKNETVAIVGHTGAGKSTIINLLMRFYDVSSGQILINGTDIRTVTRENLRSFFGMVLQDTWLIQGTIYDNIRYGNLNATKEEVIEAAKKAYAHHFISSLPDGYGTEINEEGNNLSQGQRQLITIARAFVSDPDILILDEATSSVDTRTERMIQSAMTNLMNGRTNFVIAHRLSTIVDADVILVMDKGHIVEQGNHKQLLKQNGTYADLYRSQFME
ncbi:ABC transporter ATP-binding protein [Amphibacillus xylanus]|uniref:Putative ABC transporter permease/ATP-binding protein n=1 Tax=Amphibacillus xylanus (strain ATCC 51415 / DSM 6626 / JCM 7361 / LMG 17667 / NBRC 15112 / Ep01) TaxID=698758 RepID=K0J5W0_AMPXN|nr:ABC transporter ATP-binding protein [Amphibacillus xylanus]BAM48461.1 putative ABC transporter permease/ATP-binding protein [Amphibacillus xylanus NBRC 15112]